MKTNNFHSQFLTNQIKDKTNYPYSIYSDGSFAFIILHNDIINYELCGKIIGGETHHQVTSELVGVVLAIKYLQSQNITCCNLYYDFTGIKGWAAQNWRANKPLTEKYKDFMRRANVNINYIKVKSHSGDFYNDYVDKLAKKATEFYNLDLIMKI